MPRPGLKSTLYMLALALAILFSMLLIWHGAGAPQEPARIVVSNLPGGQSQEVFIEQAGSYIIYAEQVIVPRAVDASDLAVPGINIQISDGSGVDLKTTQPGFGAWLLKILTRQRGHSLRCFEVSRAGSITVRARLLEESGQAVAGGVTLAFVRPTAAGRFFWLLLGFGGQICFSLRFIIQWLASERAGRSTVPRAFWYYSLVGGLMILCYAVYTRDPVFIMAYVLNAFIYVRNLMLIRRGDQQGGPGLVTVSSDQTGSNSL
jgi:lipid-A-disaccharide synthase-like uncharacterized protein